MAPFGRSKVLALALTVMTAMSYGQSRRSRQLLEQANESLAAGLHNKAVEQYSRLLSESADWTEVRLRRAVVFTLLGETQSALDDLTVLLQTDAKNTEALKMRGDLLLEKDRPANAVESYSRALEAGLASSAVYIGRAKAYSKLHQWSKAVADYTEGIRLKLDNPVTYRERGVVYSSLQRWHDAIEDFDRAIALKPDYWDAYVERAHAYGVIGRFDAVLPDLNKVLANKPGDVRALGLRGSANLISGDVAMAIEDYSKALEATPRDAQLLMARGSAYTRAGEHLKSLADREAAVRLRPSMPEVYIARGGSYHELGEHEKGLADRTEAIRLAPESGFAWAARGNAYFLMSRYAEAAADLEKALQYMPDDQPTRALLERAGSRAAAQLSPPNTAPAATSVEAKVSALTVASILDLPRTPEGAAADASLTEEGGSESQVTAVQPAASAGPVVLARVHEPKALPPPAVEPPAPVVAAEPIAAPPAQPVVTPEQLNQRARALMTQRKYAEAIELLSQALVLKPKFPLALNARGFSHYMLKQYDAALLDLNHAIELDTKYTNAYHNRAILLEKTGQRQAAEADRQVEQRLLQAHP